jgi:hypothetical protein
VRNPVAVRGATMYAKELVFRVTGSGDLFRAECESLDVSALGTSADAAREDLFEGVRLKSQYLVGLNGSAALDPKRPYAELVVSNWNNLEAVLKKA